MLALAALWPGPWSVGAAAAPQPQQSPQALRSTQPASLSPPQAAPRPPPPPPQVLFGDLFVAVQSAGIFPDSKVFPDAVPREAPRRILEHFHAERPRGAAALRAFVERYFVLPQESGAASERPAMPAQTPAPQPLPLAQHIDALWSMLVRKPEPAVAGSSLLPLPAPYVVPGGRFRELYYWDSYFTMLGLTPRHPGLVRDMVRDFAWLIDTYGHVPNGTRSYYLSRSQPPFFFEMVGLLDTYPAAAWARYLPELEREYAFWMRGAAQAPGSGPVSPPAPGLAARSPRAGARQAREHVVRLPGALLNRYWDDADRPRDESWREDTELARASAHPAQLYRDIRAAAESGWDFSSRWLAGRSLATLRTTQIVPVDLNSLLYGLERAIEAGCRARSDGRCVREFARRAALRRRAMDRYLWDDRAGFYRDYLWTARRRIGGVTAATFYPLFTGAASPAQAARVAAAAAPLLQPGGLEATTVRTGQQWDAPNGWAPLQWIAVRGLNAYGETALAAAIACRWLVNVRTVYDRTGRLVEKYDVQDARGGGGGEYPLQDGFGWTNGVTSALLAEYPQFGGHTSAEQCPAVRAAGG